MTMLTCLPPLTAFPNLSAAYHHQRVLTGWQNLQNENVFYHIFQFCHLSLTEPRAWSCFCCPACARWPGEDL